MLSQCAQRLYLLKLLRHQGLPDAQLSVIGNAVIISVFCMPSLHGEGSCLWNLSTKLIC